MIAVSLYRNSALEKLNFVAVDAGGISTLIADTCEKISFLNFHSFPKLCTMPAISPLEYSLVLNIF